MTTESLSLAEALPLEQARVREVLGHYKAIGYCPTTKTLACQFLRGEQKTALYPGFEPEQFKAFRTSKSLGEFFARHIKTRKDFSYADPPEKAEAESEKA